MILVALAHLNLVAVDHGMRGVCQSLPAAIPEVMTLSHHEPKDCSYSKLVGRAKFPRGCHSCHSAGQNGFTSLDTGFLLAKRDVPGLVGGKLISISQRPDHLLDSRTSGHHMVVMLS